MIEALIMVAVLGQIEFEGLPGYVPPVSRRLAPQSTATAVEASRAPDTADAVAWAVQEVVTRKALPPEHPLHWSAADVPFKRFLWVLPWMDVTAHQTNSFLVNSAINQTSVIALPEGTAGGWLIVWDLRQLATKDADLVRLIQTWDVLGFDEPYFHVQLPTSVKPLPCRSFAINGQTFTHRRTVPAPHVAEGYGLLESETLSFAPLLRADYFLRRVSSTIEGGLYYHFMGFIQGGKRLTEAEIFRTVGLDVTVSRGVEGDDRAAIFQSGVTGKPRMVEQVQGAIGKARITYDVFDEDVDAGRHAIYQLLDMPSRSRGKEIIFERANGLFGYILTDGQGKLVDVAPPNLVSDHQAPSPVTKQLFPPLSCIRCHAANSGVQAVRNDVPTLLGGGRQGDLDLFADLGSQQNRTATVNRLAGLFAATDKFYGDIERSRQSYSDAVWQATRGSGVQGREKVAPKASEQLASAYASYWYPQSKEAGNVSADQAAIELGYRVKAGEGAALLAQTIRPGRTDIVIGGVPVEFADPSIAALRRGMSIRRQDFERVYAQAAYLVTESRKAQK